MSERGLTLTEELERLEQSVTLTLQEIDSNFSRAHQTITGRILPIVEQYAKNSVHIWNGSKFWKQFFEASANVSLSGYEEPIYEEPIEGRDTTDGNAIGETFLARDRGTLQKSPLGTSASPIVFRPGTAQASLSHNAVELEADQAAISSHQLTRQRALRNTITSDVARDLANEAALPDLNRLQTNTSASETRAEIIKDGSVQRNKLAGPKDMVLHRVLDKTFKVQTTPRLNSTIAGPAGSTSIPFPTTGHTWGNSPESPDIAVPQLRSELFSPFVASKVRDLIKSTACDDVQSVDKPTHSYGTATPTPTIAAKQLNLTRTSMGDSTHQRRMLVVDDTNDDLLFDLSPPKTIQFHVPSNHLLQTPAREASKKIIDDLLFSAGLGDSDDDFDDGNLLNTITDSPSVIKKHSQNW